MASFQDLGLSDTLVQLLDEEELERPTALQQSVIPVLRRGGNLVARTSTGSGKTLAYGLGVLDQMKAPEDEDEETPLTQALVLVPTGEEAERVATALFPYVNGSGFALAVAGDAWGTAPGSAHLLIATPAAALAAVRDSEVKLDGLVSVVIDGASAIEALGQWSAVDTLLDHLPRDAQRVVISSAMTNAVDDLIDRRVKRAVRYPAEPAIAEAAVAPTGTLGYAPASEREKLDLLARLLRQRGDEAAAPVLFFRSDERAAQVAEALAMRGFAVGEPGEEATDVVLAMAGASRAEIAEDADGALGASISYDVPADEATLLARHQGDAQALVLVDPRELPHLREIAGRAHLTPKAVLMPTPETGRAQALESFRTEVQRALGEEDLAAQMLVLEPLFQEYPAAEVAAALAALLRTRRPATAPATAAATAAAPAAAQASARSAAPAEEAVRSVGAPPATWARLYVGVGSRDDVRPGDLVGAIAGEANIPGSRVGRIDIRDTFSVVEVQAEVADQVIRAVNGTTIKGRSVRVDFDRGGDRARKPPMRRGPGAPGGAAGGERTPRRRPRE